MAFCLCNPFSCPDEGLVSVNYTGTSNSRVDPGTNNIIPGPATGTVSMAGYAFLRGADKWLGVRCPSSAQGSQTNIIKFNACTGKFIIIPTKVHSASRTGDAMEGVAMSEFCSIDAEPAFLQNGVTVSQQTTTVIGHSLSFRGVVIPDLVAKRVLQTTPCFVQSLSIRSEFPRPAMFTVTYQFIIDC